MGAIHRITKNVIVLVSSNVIGKAITFFYIVIAARYLGVANFGELSFALAFTSIFSVLADLGLSRLQIREIAKDKSCVSKITTNILFLKIFLGVANLLIMALTINLLNYPPQTVLLVYILGLSVVFTNFEASLESVFQGFEKMSYMAVARVLSSLVLLLGAILITNSGAGLTEFAIAYLASSIVVVAFELVVLAKKFVLINKVVDLGFSRQLIKEALPFALSGMFLVLYIRFDSILLSMFKGETAVGLYSASYKLVDALNIVYFSFMVALFPVTSRLFKYSKEKLLLSFEKSLKYLIVLSVPIAVGTTILSDRIIELVYGVQYEPSVLVLQILIWSAALVFINSILSNLFDSIGKQTISAKQNVLAAIINLAINLVLIPTYSYIGASIATTITQLFSFVYLYLAVSKTEFKLHLHTFLIILSKVALASLVMGAFTVYFKSMNILFLVPLSTLLYFFSFYLLGGIDRYDTEIAKNLISKF